MMKCCCKTGILQKYGKILSTLEPLIKSCKTARPPPFCHWKDYVMLSHKYLQIMSVKCTVSEENCFAHFLLPIGLSHSSVTNKYNSTWRCAEEKVGYVYKKILDFQGLRSLGQISFLFSPTKLLVQNVST